MLHGVLADREALRDRLVGVAGRDGGGYLELTRGESERLLRARRGGSGGRYRGAQRLHEIGDPLAPDPVLAAADAADAPEQEVDRRFLHDDAPGPELEGLDELLLLDGRGEQDRAHRSRGLARKSVGEGTQCEK